MVLTEGVATVLMRHLIELAGSLVEVNQAVTAWLYWENILYILYYMFGIANVMFTNKISVDISPHTPKKI